MCFSPPSASADRSARCRFARNECPRFRRRAVGRTPGHFAFRLGAPEAARRFGALETARRLGAPEGAGCLCAAEAARRVGTQEDAGCLGAREAAGRFGGLEAARRLLAPEAAGCWGAAETVRVTDRIAAGAWVGISTAAIWANGTNMAGA